jgi:5'-nucleotidase
MPRRSLLASVAIALAALTGSVQAAHPEPQTVTVKVIGLNDYHGNLQSPGTFGVNTTIPAASRPPVGGAEYVAAWVAKLKAENPYNVVVGAGDFIGATPLISALFYDEPSVETLNRIGLEFNAVGNHEFDKGSAELLRLQKGGCKITAGLADPNSCRGAEVGTPVPFEGAGFHWLSANVVNNATGRTLLPAYGVKRFKTRPKGADPGFSGKIAFIGMTLEGTPTIVTPTGVAGLTFRDEADTVNALIPQLRRNGIEAVVVLIHQGGFQTGAGNASDINGCLGDLKNSNGTDSEIRQIVARLDNEVDLVISGHTHSAYNCSANTVDVVNAGGVALSTPRPTGLPNRVGRLVPVTSASAFGRVLSDIDLKIDRATGEVLAVDARNVLVDRTNADAGAWVAANPAVRNIVEAYNVLQAPLAGQVIGTILEPLPNVGNVAGEMPAGDLIADAQLQATQPAGLGGAVMAFMNPGGVRSPGFNFAGAIYPYNVTYGNAFTVQPFGNSLVTLTLTAQQLKNLLEQQFVGCLGQTTQRILQPSNGIVYKWSASAPPCAKIVELSFTPTDVVAVPAVVTGPTVQIVSGGALTVPPDTTYRVTVNNFLATGGDGFTVLVSGSNPLGGAQDIDALVAYLSAFKAPLPPYTATDPALGTPRITLDP